MELNTTPQQISDDPVVFALFNQLHNNQITLGLENAHFYYDFPIYRDYEGSVVTCKAILVSPFHGVLVIGTAEGPRNQINTQIARSCEYIDDVLPLLLSRLIKNRALREGTDKLKIGLSAIVWSPISHECSELPPSDYELLGTESELNEYLVNIRKEIMDDVIFQELISTIQGAKGLIRPRFRDVSHLSENSKASIVAKLEQEIANFDKMQRHGYNVYTRGPQRIRGLAGSGKTVVLCMKAAQIHLRYPDATCVYTFYTKSLYQHIKRLITRFYREFDDRDVDWSKIHILHGWGGKDYPGMYSEACKILGARFYNFREANLKSPSNPFGFACQKLLDSRVAKPIFDYVLVDEGQDFPLQFLTLASMLAKNRRIVWAYDELQTIFQTKPPSHADIFGSSSDSSTTNGTNDIILYKCYRNPREILICAHAIGLGIYGDKMVQMLENKEHWEDVGYHVLEGEFTANSNIVIERPSENSLQTISDSCSIDEIVKASAFEEYGSEIEYIVGSIKTDIENGLCPEDILVIVADDRNAKTYLRHITKKLNQVGILTNDIHSDSFGLFDFQEKNKITLSTIYKAKGNEAFMVYVVGVDSIFAIPDIVNRNKLFTAMTRAKGWLEVTGVGLGAVNCKKEIELAKQKFPNLEFTYPSTQQIKQIKHDLRGAAASRHRIDRQLDLLIENLGIEGIRKVLDLKSSSVKKVIEDDRDVDR